MKTILRDSLTGLYYGGNQDWCAEVSGAMDFDSIRTAAWVAQEQKLETVNVVLRYEEPACELALPLGLVPRAQPRVRRVTANAREHPAGPRDIRHRQGSRPTATS